MSKETNFWDFLIKTIPILGTLAGVLFSYSIRNFGKVNFELYNFTFKLKKSVMDPYGNQENKTYNLKEAKIGESEIVIDFQNSSENIRNIKDVDIIFESEIDNFDFEITALNVNGEKTNKNRDNEIVNIINFYSKELKRVKIKGKFELENKDVIRKYGLKVYLFFRNHRGKEKKKFLTSISSEQIEQIS